jgi:hypothetical protein
MPPIRTWISLAIFLPCMAMASCATTPANARGDSATTRHVGDGEAFAIAPGGAVTLADGSRLLYAGISADSRCPPDVTCVWAGDAEAAFEWTSTAGATQDFSLHTGRGDRERMLGERRIALLSVARGAAPEAQLRIEAMP